MSALFAGPDRLTEWITPLISATLVGSDDEARPDTLRHDNHQIASKSSSKASSSSLAKIVQVVRIGRPLHKENIDTPLSPKIQEKLSVSLNTTDEILGKIPRSTSTDRLVMNPSRVDETVPTSLLISDGQTTILALLSNETRIGLSELATNDSLFQNNTITKGCVIKLIDWKLDTMGSACSIISSKSSTFSMQKIDYGSDKEEDSDDTDELKDRAVNDIFVQPQGTDLLRDDPLLREHQQLLHQSANNVKRNSHITSDNVIVLRIIGSVEVVGCHGMAEVGRPCYIMDTVDVRRAAKFLTTAEIYSRIQNKNACLIDYFVSKSVYVKPNIVVPSARRISDTPETEIEAVKKRKLFSGDENLVIESASSVPIVEDCDSDRGLEERGRATLASCYNDDDADLPIGNVEELFQSPTKSALNDICKMIEDERKKGLDGGAIKPNNLSSELSSTAPSTLNEYDRKRMQELFKDTPRTRKRKISMNKQTEAKHYVSFDPIEQDVMSDEYSSDMSCDDNDVVNLSIGNMLLTQEEECQFKEDEALNGNQLAAVAVQSKESVDVHPESGSERETHTEVGSTASFIKLANTLEKVKELNTGFEVTGHPSLKDKEICDEPLECQPIHPIVASSNAEENIDVGDDDVSVEEEGDNIFQFETQEVVHHHMQIDRKLSGNPQKFQTMPDKTGEDDDEEFHDALTNEPDDEVVSVTPLDSINENEELDEDSEMVLRPLLGTQHNCGEANHPDDTLKSRNEMSAVTSPASIEATSTEFTFDGWMKNIRNFRNSGRNEVDEWNGSSADAGYGTGGDPIRALLSKYKDNEFRNNDSKVE